MAPIAVTVGICAYNEEANIEKAIRSIYDQSLDDFEITKMIAVSSGSTDNTDDIVRKLTEEFDTLVLIPQAKREGKNSAINCFLDNKDTEIVTIMNADTVFAKKNSLQSLLEPFKEEKVGIVGGRPIPTNSTDSIAGYASHVIWSMHHHVSMIQPKIGEIIAFRDIGTRLPSNTSGDEDTLKMRIEEAGYISVYAPDAEVFNKGPETVRDFVKQRTRVNVGECCIKANHDFAVPTWSIRMLYPAFVETAKELGFHPIKLMMASMMEFYSRLKAYLFVKLNKSDISVWEPVKTTKKL